MTTITLTHPSWIIFRTKYDMSYAYHSTGICWDGTNFYIVHTDNIRVYKYDSALSSELESYDIGILGGNDNPEGIEWDGTNFFVTDLDANVYKYLSDFSAPPTAYDLTLLGGNANPYGICWDGTNFFVVDNADGIVYKYPSDFSVKTAEYDIDAVSAGANGSPRGICWDGTYFWVTDSDGYLYQYPSDFSSLTASYNIGYLGDTNDEPYGIDYDGTYFFVIDYNNSDIFKYEYLIDVDITSKVKRFIINHPLKRTPTASGQIFNQALEYDDIIQVKGTLTSYLNSKIDQNGEIYKESLDFRSDTIGSAATDWTVSVAAGTDAYVIDKYNEHARVLQVEDLSAVNAATITHTISPADQTYGTIEFYIGTTDVTKTSAFYVRGNGNNMFAIRIDSSTFEKYDSGGWAATGASAVTGKLYHISIDFECTTGEYDSRGDGVLAQYNWRLYIDDTEYGDYDMNSNEAHADALQIYTNAGDTNFLSFWDAFGFTWDTDYTLGDNLDLEVTLADQTLFEGRVIEETSEYTKGIKLDSLSVEGEEIHPGVRDTAYNPDGYAHIANYTEEAIAETINAKCSTITATLTDEIYRGTYSFENDTDNATPMGCVCSGAVTVAAESVGSHKYTLEFADDNGSETMLHYFEDQTYGTVEFWYHCDDPTDGFFVQLLHGATAVLGVGVDNDEWQYWKNDSTWANCATITTGPTASTWYRVRLDFECTTGEYTGLAQYDYSITVYDTTGAIVDGVEDDIDMDSNEAHVDNIYFFTSAVDTGHTVNIDAIGFSWDKHYNIGDNAHIYIYGVEVGGETIDFSLQGEHSIERLANTVADLDVNIWKYSPSHAWLYDSGTLDNQITLTKYCRRVRGTDFLERYNDIITKGGWAAGPTIAYGGDSDSDAQTTYGIKTISRFYTSVTSTTTLDSIAAAILSLQGNTPKIVELEFRNTTYGMFAVGELITVPASTIRYSGNSTYLDAGSWLISSVRYDCIRDVNIMRLVNTLFFEYNYNLIEELETLSYGLIV